MTMNEQVDDLKTEEIDIKEELEEIIDDDNHFDFDLKEEGNIINVSVDGKPAKINKIFLYKLVTTNNGLKFKCNVNGCFEKNSTTDTKSQLVDHLSKCHKYKYAYWFGSYNVHFICEKCDFSSTKPSEAICHRKLCTKTLTEDVQFYCSKCKFRVPACDYEQMAAHVIENLCKSKRKFKQPLLMNRISTSVEALKKEVEEIIDDDLDVKEGINMNNRSKNGKPAKINKIFLFKLVTTNNANGSCTKFKCNVKGCFEKNSTTDTKSQLVDHLSECHKYKYAYWFGSYNIHFICEKCDFSSTKQSEAIDHRELCTKTLTEDVQYYCSKCKFRVDACDYEKIAAHVNENLCKSKRKFKQLEIEAAIKRSKVARNKPNEMDGVQEVSLFTLKHGYDNKIMFKCNVFRCSINPVFGKKSKLFDHIKSSHPRHYQDWFGSTDHYYVCENCKYNFQLCFAM